MKKSILSLIVSAGVFAGCADEIAQPGAVRAPDLAVASAAVAAEDAG